MNSDPVLIEVTVNPITTARAETSALGEAIGSRLSGMIWVNPATEGHPRYVLDLTSQVRHVVEEFGG